MVQHDGPAAEGLAPGWFPSSPVARGRTAPVPRRVRAVLGGRTVVDTTAAVHVWEHPWYPRLYLPDADVDRSLLQDDGRVLPTPQGTAALHSLVVGEERRPGAARFLATSPLEALIATWRLDWQALDAWFEEEEEVFVHARSPYVRVDALRSSRHVRVEADGVLLAETDRPVGVFETGLPPRWYVERSAVRWEHLRGSPTRTECPYKGRTTGYWSARVPGGLREDVAWSYDFPTLALAPVRGLVAFDDAAVDVTVEPASPQSPT